jgi:hypothetical protein
MFDSDTTFAARCGLPHRRGTHTRGRGASGIRVHGLGPAGQRRTLRRPRERYSWLHAVGCCFSRCRPRPSQERAAQALIALALILFRIRYWPKADMA